MAVALGRDMQAVLNESGGLWIFGAEAMGQVQLPTLGAACLGAPGPAAPGAAHLFANEALMMVSAEAISYAA